MRSIPVNLTHTAYDIHVGAGLLDDLQNQLAAAGLCGPFLVVSQPRILKALGQRCARQFPIVRIPDGERAKTLATVNRLIDAMVKNKLTRQSTIVAVGGGVVGDV